jgi:Uma2 family endonuclease
VNPQPTLWHQIVGGNLAFLVKLYLRDQKLGVLLHPPVDVVLAQDTVLHPDLAVLLDEHRDRIREAGIFGAPDFVIEVLMPSTELRDRHDKLEVYSRYGVREYWLADPERRRIEVFVLESGRLVKKAQHDSGEARSLAVLPGFAAPLSEVFRRP